MKHPIIIVADKFTGKRTLEKRKSAFDILYIENVFENDTYAYIDAIKYSYYRVDVDFILVDYSLELCKKLKRTYMFFVMVMPYPSIDNIERYERRYEDNKRDYPKYYKFSKLNFVDNINEAKEFAIENGISFISLDHPDSKDMHYLSDVVHCIVDLVLKGGIL